MSMQGQVIVVSFNVTHCTNFRDSVVVLHEYKYRLPKVAFDERTIQYRRAVSRECGLEARALTT
jgi:hypothetical protein